MNKIINMILGFLLSIASELLSYDSKSIQPSFYRSLSVKEYEGELYRPQDY